MNIKISVVTATYNSCKTLKDCLDSVALQSYHNKEHIVIDGASLDGTVDLLSCYKDRIASMISEPDNGIYDALNKGIKLASGDVIGFLHADDIFATTDSLDYIAGSFADPDVLAVYGDLQYVQKESIDRIVRNWRSSSFTPEKLAMGWMPPHPTFYVRRSVYEQIGLFDTSYQIAADYDFVLRFFKLQNIRVDYVPRTLVKMRVGGASNRSIKNILIKSLEDYRAIKNNQVGGIGSLICKNLRKLNQFF